MRDEVDVGAGVAAERAGLPHTAVLLIAAGAYLRHARLAEPATAYGSSTVAIATGAMGI